MTRALLPLALISALFSGCYVSHGGDGPSPSRRDGGIDIGVTDSGVIDSGVIGTGRRDAGRPDSGDIPVPPPPPPGDSTFVIAELLIPEPAGQRAPGANLDGMDSGRGSTDIDANCEEFNADFRSVVDGTRGVDNAYSLLVPTVEGLVGRPVDAVARDSILSGQLLIVISLHDGGGFVLELAVPAEPLRSTAGRLDAGNVVRVAQPLGRGSYRTEGRRIVAEVDEFAAMIPSGLVPLLPLGFLQQVQVRFEQTPGGLVDGEIGGWVTVDEMVGEASVIMPGIEDTARSVLESVADIRPGRDPAICEGLSVGMSFDAVPVILVR